MADVLNAAQLTALLQQANQAIVGLQQQIQQQQEQLEQLQAGNAASALAGVMRYKPRRPDTYDGKRSLGAAKNWLRECRTYFEACGDRIGVNDLPKITFAISLLRGQASLWWQAREQREAVSLEAPIDSWNDFENVVSAAFSPINEAKQARDMLRKARQRTSVQAFVNELRTIRLFLPSLTDDELLDRFMAGLKPFIQKELALRDPTSFEQAVQMAERLDAVLFQTTKNGLYNQHHPGRPTDPNGPAPMEISAISSTQQPAGNFCSRDSQRQPGNFQNGSSGQRFPKLTPEVRQQLIKEGRCLYCRDKGHLAINCPKKKYYPPRN